MPDIKNSIVIIGHLSLDRIKTTKSNHNDVFGGAALYTAVASSVRKTTPSIISTYCSDFPLNQLVANLNNRINFDQVLLVIGSQRRAFMEYSQDFQRTSYNHAREKWLLETINQCPRHLPKLKNNYKAAILVPTLPSVQGEYAQWFKRNTTALVALDTSEFYAERYKSDLLSAIENVDLFMPSDVELNLLFPEHSGSIMEHIKSVERIGVQYLIIKRSTNGALIVDYNRKIILMVGIRKTETIDATGAGDTFNGAFVSDFIVSELILESAKYAAALSSYCVEDIGYSRLLDISESDIVKAVDSIEVVTGTL